MQNDMKIKFIILNKVFIIYYLLRKCLIDVLVKLRLRGINQDLLVGKEGATATYCYSVWLRHIIYCNKVGLDPYPNVVAELGPGSSLGVGLAALISGSNSYVALEKVKFASEQDLLGLFDKLVELFRARADVPGPNKFPNLKPFLKTYKFPKKIYDDKYMEKVLNHSRIESIRKAVLDFSHNGNNKVITYAVPWDESRVEWKNGVDLILSQAVLEHVDDLKNVYQQMNLWLKSSGFISHQVDFKHHKTSFTWNGHWLYSPEEFNFMRGKETFLINRMPWSKHLEYIKEAGFSVIFCKEVINSSIISIDDTKCSKLNLNEADLELSGNYFVANKSLN